MLLVDEKLSCAISRRGLLHAAGGERRGRLVAVPGLWKDLQEEIHHEGSRAEPAHVRIWPFLSTLFENVQD